LHVRIALCEGCGASHVCPGPQRGMDADVAATGRRLPAGAPGIPPTEERRQVLQEMRSVILRDAPPGEPQERRVLRINFHCNQACDFCFVSRQLPAPEEELIERELVDAARAGASLAISGGEPTLNARLPEYIARATALGITQLELQTNAVKMSDRPYAAALAAAGLRAAFVSLHGTTAATSDRVTSAPGTFGKTVEGMRNLLREGVLVRANFVVCGYNAAEFPALPDFVDRELRSVPGARVDVNFSFVAPSSNVPRDTALVPRFSQVAWALEAALARAEAIGLAVVGFDSQCGVPPCFLPERIRASAFAADLPEQELRAFAGSFRKSDACASCSLTRRCYGVRAGYAEMYGTDELHPV
jgi:pyruvate-formate lyase-activating enzyme